MFFSELLRELRTEKGYSQKKLADLSGISQAAIYQWEKGTRKPKIEQLKKLSIALDVPLRTFLLKMDEKERIQTELELFQDNNKRLESLLIEILEVHHYRIEPQNDEYIIIINHDKRYTIKYADFIDMLSRCDKDIRYNIEKLLDVSK